MGMKTKTPIIAYNKGYRVIDGEVININTGNKRKLNASGVRSYPKFSIDIFGKSSSCKAHQLLAYQKFGLVCFKVGVFIRHYDDDMWNLSDDNIILGTRNDNMIDKIRNNLLKKVG